MTRLELLKILVGQARTNGFEFRRWYTTRLALPWTGAEEAFSLLESQRRYYALLFSHEFAESFWKAGAPITFKVSPKSYERRMADGSIRTIQTASYQRRSGRPDVWRYHLREMALAEEPLRYMNRYLHVEDELDDAPAALVTLAASAAPVGKLAGKPEASPTLALARKAHERRQQALALTAVPSTPSTARRGARPPGTRTKTPSRPSSR